MFDQDTIADPLLFNGPVYWEEVKAQSYRFTDHDLPYDAKVLEYRLQQVDVDGKTTIVGERLVTLSDPQTIELLSTYPNPTTVQTTARVGIPESITDAKLMLFDVLGRQVRDIPILGSGRRTVQLRTRDLAPGTYFLRLTGGGQVRTQKLTVVR